MPWWLWPRALFFLSFVWWKCNMGMQFCKVGMQQNCCCLSKLDAMPARPYYNTLYTLFCRWPPLKYFEGIHSTMYRYFWGQDHGNDISHCHAILLKTVTKLLVLINQLKGGYRSIHNWCHCRRKCCLVEAGAEKKNKYVSKNILELSSFTRDLYYNFKKYAYPIKGTLGLAGTVDANWFIIYSRQCPIGP